MPKLVINSGGDEFFLPDDNYYFWDDLPGPKYLRSVTALARFGKYIVSVLFFDFLYACDLWSKNSILHDSQGVRISC